MRPTLAAASSLTTRGCTVSCSAAAGAVDAPGMRQRGCRRAPTARICSRNCLRIDDRLAVDTAAPGRRAQAGLRGRPRRPSPRPARARCNGAPMPICASASASTSRGPMRLQRQAATRARGLALRIADRQLQRLPFQRGLRELPAQVLHRPHRSIRSPSRELARTQSPPRRPACSASWPPTGRAEQALGSSTPIQLPRIQQHRQQQVGQRAPPPRWPRARTGAGG